MQLTCSHHEFSLHHYMGTLQEPGRLNYSDGINMHALRANTHTHKRTHTALPDAQKPMHLFRCTHAEE